MSSGIYALYWESIDKIYIGKSIDLDIRKASHEYLMKKGKHFNYKVQEAFNNNGLPVFQILEFCLPSKLNELEISYISDYDSFSLGFNLTKGGDGSYGENHPGSKYSNQQIEEAFLLLYTRDTLHKDIAIVTGVSLDVIKAISRGYLHTWLSEKYPNEYKELLASVKSAHNSGEKHSSATITNEQVITLFKDLVHRSDPLTIIAEKHAISYSIVSMIASGCLHRWLEIKFPTEYQQMLSNVGKVCKHYPLVTNGTEIVQVENATEFCYKNNLQLPNLSKVFSGKRKSHKGWSLYA